MRLFSTVVLFIFLGGALPAFAQSSHGVFKVVKGDVTVTSKEGKSNKAKIGLKVQPGEKIKAGKDSRAKIVMVDNNELNVSPDSEIIIEDYQFKPNENKKNVLINVLYGKVRAKVNQKYEGDNKFQVKTKSAVAGVRGTDFFTSYSPTTNATKVVTFEGRVQFGLPGANGAINNSVMVGVGQTTTVTGSAPPPPPVAVPKTEMTAMDQSSDADKGSGAPEPREPAAQQPEKKDAPKEAPKEQPKDAPKDAPKDGPKAEQPKGQPSSGSTAGGPAAGAAAPGSEGRGPAALPPAGSGPMPGAIASPGSMIRVEDMPSAGVVAPILPPVLPPTFVPPTTVYAPPTCEICNQIIEGQNKTLRITVINGD